MLENAGSAWAGGTWWGSYWQGAFANFCGVNTSTMADFKPPSVTQNYVEMGSVGSCEPESTGSWRAVDRGISDTETGTHLQMYPLYRNTETNTYWHRHIHSYTDTQTDDRYTAMDTDTHMCICSQVFTHRHTNIHRHTGNNTNTYAHGHRYMYTTLICEDFTRCIF